MSAVTTDLAGFEVISTYTRAQAIADGVLVDVTRTAREAGYRVPVAMTAGAWADAVAWDEDNQGLQDPDGRLWDVLTLATHTARRVGPGMSRVAFGVLRVPNEPDAIDPVLTTLHLHMGPGDAGEPVLTVLLPLED